MRYIRYLLIATFGIALIAIALANRAPVEIKLLPEQLSDLFGLAPRMELPLFIVVYGGIVAGLFVGFVWEWLREWGHRRHEAELERETRRLKREIKGLKD
jgi:uncharacterized integral membrane protein